MKITDVQNLFADKGGDFYLSAKKIIKKLENIKAFIFDWDGVFHNGGKSDKSFGTFSEIDAMGLNLMQFSFWLKKEKKLPVRGIITGARENPTAEYFAKRQHFTFIKTHARKKDIVLDNVCQKYDLKKNQVAYIFDDVNDFSVAKKCGLRFYVERNANPLLSEFIKEKKFIDYSTSHKGGDGAVREICELIMGLNQNFRDVFNGRIEYSEDYKNFWDLRNSIDTEVL